MSVATKFQNFCQDIAIPSATRDSVSYRYGRITRQLNTDFWGASSETSHSLYVGSYGRDTAIHISDIDMLMRLPVSYYHTYNSYQGNGQSALLQSVRNSLQKTYPTTSLKGDGQVVVVSFNDGATLEILPCFLNTDDISFTYPDANSGGTWKTTNPSAEIQAIRSANERWNYNLKRLCRMTRARKDEWDVPIGGILIDTLAYDFLFSWEHSDKSFLYYDWMVRDFFRFLSNQNSQQQYWLAMGSGKHIYREGNFEYKALQCYNIAVEAVRHEADNQDWSATQKWRDVFGTKFVG